MTDSAWFKTIRFPRCLYARYLTQNLDENGVISRVYLTKVVYLHASGDVDVGSKPCRSSAFIVTVKSRI